MPKNQKSKFNLGDVVTIDAPSMTVVNKEWDDLRDDYIYKVRWLYNGLQEENFYLESQLRKY